MKNSEICQEILDKTIKSLRKNPVYNENAFLINAFELQENDRLIYSMPVFPKYDNYPSGTFDFDSVGDEYSYLLDEYFANFLRDNKK